MVYRDADQVAANGVDSSLYLFDVSSADREGGVTECDTIHTYEWC